MLSINQFFSNFAGEGSVPSEEDLQPIQDFLVNAGAQFAIDSENTEMDEIIIECLTSKFEHYNWEVVFEYDGYWIGGCADLKCWILHWEDSEINGAPNTWFVG